MIADLFHSAALDHPIAKCVFVVLGAGMLLHGRVLLRLLAGALLFITGGVICVRFLIPHIDALLPPDVWLRLICVVISACLFVATLRFAVVQRWIEVVIAVLAAMLAAPLTDSLGAGNISIGVGVSLVIATILSRTALITIVAALCFLFTIDAALLTVPVALAVLGSCAFVAWLRHGRYPAQRIGLVGSRGLASQSAGEGVEPVVGVFGSSRAAQRWTHAQRRSGYSARVLAGLDRVVLTEVGRTRAVLMQSFSSAYGLFVSVPDVLDRANRMIPQTSVCIETTTENSISLEEISERLRTDRRGRALRGRGTQGEGVTVAVIDTGMEMRPEFADRVIDRVSVVSSEPSPDDESESKHGSNVAQIIAALAPKARLLSIKAFAKSGRGQLGWILDALSLAVRKNVDVVNASWGGCACKGQNKCILCLSVNGMSQVVCASAGNAGPSPRSLSCPGAAKRAIGTASCNRDGEVSAFSSRGPSEDPTNPKPDITGYGERVLLRTGQQGPNNVAMSGTSFSAPQTTAGAAVILSAARAAGDTTAHRNVRSIIQRSARCDDLRTRDRNAVGAGLLSLSDAVRLLQSKVPATAGALTPLRMTPVRAAAAIVLWVAGVWWFGLDHGYTLGDASDGPVLMFGRVRDVGAQMLVFDDGTAALPLRNDPSSTVPMPGALALFECRWNASDAVLEWR